jgi:hypothetical protein
LFCAGTDRCMEDTTLAIKQVAALLVTLPAATVSVRLVSGGDPVAGAWFGLALAVSIGVVGSWYGLFGDPRRTGEWLGL